MDWNDIFNQGRDFRVMNTLLLEKLLKRIGRNTGTALDLGCGTGDLAVKLAGQGFSVDAIDISSIALGKAKKRAQEVGVAFETHQADLNDTWPPLDGPFTLITCKLVLAFIQDKNRFLNQVKELLGQDGTFLLITPVLHSDHKYNKRLQGISIPNEELDILLQKHFQSIEVAHNEYFEELGHEKYFIITP